MKTVKQEIKETLKELLTLNKCKEAGIDKKFSNRVMYINLLLESYNDVSKSVTEDELDIIYKESLK